jgi:hypothetical protein
VAFRVVSSPSDEAKTIKKIATLKLFSKNEGLILGKRILPPPLGFEKNRHREILSILED